MQLNRPTTCLLACLLTVSVAVCVPCFVANGFTVFSGDGDPPNHELGPESNFSAWHWNIRRQWQNNHYTVSL